MYTVDDYMMEEPIYSHECANCHRDTDPYDTPLYKFGHYFCCDDCLAEFVYNDDEILLDLFDNGDIIREFIDRAGWDKWQRWIRE